jgi:uncharacterized membrane protein YgdD (TMEM256/DUF423 family)
MNKTFLVTASLLGALSVALGAFGAHGLRVIASPDTVAIFETGVRYQFYHSFALLMVGILAEKFPGPLLRWAGNCFLIGTVLFSGSLYLLTFLRISDISGWDRIGLVTPIGGLFFIAGWFLMLLSFVRNA